MLPKILASILLVLTVTTRPAQAPEITPPDDSAVLVGRLTVAKPITPDTARAYVKHRATLAGYSKRQWKCLDEIIYRESRWQHQADNPHSSAFGLFQQLKLDPTTGVRKQTERGLRYITHRYGSDQDPIGACSALAFHDKNGWY